MADFSVFNWTNLIFTWSGIILNFHLVSFFHCWEGPLCSCHSDEYQDKEIFPFPEITASSVANFPSYPLWNTWLLSMTSCCVHIHEIFYFHLLQNFPVLVTTFQYLFSVYSHLDNTKEMQSIFMNPLSKSVKWLIEKKKMASHFLLIPFSCTFISIATNLHGFCCSIFLSSYFASFLMVMCFLPDPYMSYASAEAHTKEVKWANMHLNFHVSAVGSSHRFTQNLQWPVT